MTMISQVMDGIVYVDAAGLIKLMNPVAEEFLRLKSFMVEGPFRSRPGVPALATHRREGRPV